MRNLNDWFKPVFMIIENDSEPGEHELLKKIATLRKQREALLSQVSVLNIQLESYEDAAKLVYGKDQFSAFMGALVGNVAPSMPTVYGPEPKRKRSISVNWATVLMALGGLPSFNYDQIVSVSDIKDLGITIAAARSQMKTYIASGMVDRVADGIFKVTDKGRAAADESLRKAPPPPPTAAEVFGSTVAPSVIPPVPPVPPPPTMTRVPPPTPPPPSEGWQSKWPTEVPQQAPLWQAEPAPEWLDPSELDDKKKGAFE